MKNAGIRIRIDREQREAFQSACRAQGCQASDVLREFIVRFIALHGSAQRDLFVQLESNKSIQGEVPHG
ncbi:MAG: plasmid-related protein [Thiomonas sp.]